MTNLDHKCACDICLLEMLSHLVQSGLGHGVVLYPEKLFVLSEDAKDVSEGGEGGGKLVL